MKGASSETYSKEELNKKSDVASSRRDKRASLFRTPISGGVQSATCVHDLPRPPLAVHNLMEQVYKHIYNHIR